MIAPFPTYALGGGAKEWNPIFSFIIVIGFCLLSIIPAIVYTFKRGKSKFWNISTYFLCWLGILTAFITNYNLFPESVSYMMITFLLSSLPFGLVLKKAIKASWKHHF